MKVGKKALGRAISLINEHLEVMSRSVLDLVARVEVERIRTSDLVRRLNALEHERSRLASIAVEQNNKLLEVEAHSRRQAERCFALESRLSPVDPADIPEWKAKMRAELEAERNVGLGEIRVGDGIGFEKTTAGEIKFTGARV